MHSFANAKDRKSRFVWYKKGEIYKQEQTQDFKKFPEPTIYLKEFYYTVRWVLHSKITWDIYVGLDGLCVLFGNLLRKISKVKRTIFWAIDFVPKNRFKLGVKNRIYQFINRSSDLEADEIWDLSPRMLKGREKYLGIKKSDYKKHKLVQYGLWVDRIKPVAYKNCDKYTLMFIGNLSQYQGLQLIVQTLPKLIKKYPKIRLRVLGDGEYSPAIKKLAKNLNVYKYCDFLGRIDDTLVMESLTGRAAIGLAPYMHALDYISRYTDLGKIKTYLACGIPVLTTDIPWNAREIEKYKCGLIITESEEDIIEKISFLIDSKNNTLYRSNALKYAKSFNFQEIFDKNFP
jgi:glycosyltransferase involved in cell wall biosynthesis